MLESLSSEHIAGERRSGTAVAVHLRDLILGGQDGLVNVLGLILGLTAAGSGAHVVIVGGLAALLAESIAMGGVQYTSLSAERDYYYAELNHERKEVEEMPDAERAEIRQIFHDRGLRGDLLEQVVDQITSDKDLWVDVMMRDELNLSRPESGGLVSRGLLVGLACAVGSAIPIIPFIVLPLATAPYVATILCAVVLFGVGAYKAVTLVGRWWSSGLQMLAIGLVSAFAGYLIGLALHVNA